MCARVLINCARKCVIMMTMMMMMIIMMTVKYFDERERD